MKKWKQTEEQIEKQMQTLVGSVPPDQLDMMIGMTYMIGVASAIKNTNSFDADECANELYLRKHKCTPLSKFRAICEEFIPILLLEDWVRVNTDGTPLFNPEADFIIWYHENVLLKE